MIDGEEDSGTGDAGGYRSWDALQELATDSTDHRQPGQPDAGAPASSADRNPDSATASRSGSLRSVTAEEHGEFEQFIATEPVKRKRHDFDQHGTAAQPNTNSPKGKSRGYRAQIPGMDKATARKLSRGEITPDGKLDLHKRTFEEARHELDGFVRSGLMAGHRLLLVVTGQGKHSPNDGTVLGQRQTLRAALPHWVETAGWSHDIVVCCTAHVKHGGAGAYYLYLKQRK